MIETSVYPGQLVLQEDSADAPKTGLGVMAGLSAAMLAGLWLAGSGSLLRIAIPALAAFVGLIIYLRFPILYVQYALWIWFLSPLARRLVDWRFGFTDPNLVLLAPLLVSGISGLGFVRKDSNVWRDIPVAFVVCGMAIFYGFAVGMFMQPSAETVYGLLNWICPMLFGLHLYSHWREYEKYRDAIGKSFLWGALILGVYGIYQFFLAPAWDCLWLENVRAAQTGTSFGLPEPYLIRVWSTMNAPGPFANTMMVALFVLFVVRSSLKLPAAIAGYTSFLLSIVRTAWLSWIVGFIWIMKSSKPRVVIRIVLSIAVLVICLLPFLSGSQMALVISDRISTFTDLKRDDSFGAREEMYRVLANDAINNPFGHGLRNLETSHGMAVDSGILTVLFSLGWVGALLFTVGVFFLFISRMPKPAIPDDFLEIWKAAIIAILVQIVGGNIFVSITGVLFWMMAAMHLAAGKYHNESAEQWN